MPSGRVHTKSIYTSILTPCKVNWMVYSKDRLNRFVDRNFNRFIYQHDDNSTVGLCPGAPLLMLMLPSV